jgi:hypothetical protein
MKTMAGRSSRTSIFLNFSVKINDKSIKFTGKLL